MGENTNIEWADHTFNPWMGCTKVSPACDDCYAVRQTARLHVEWGRDAERRVTSDSYWAQPLSWDRKAAAAGERRRVFCASLADVFEGRPGLDPIREELWDLIAATPNLDWLLLTKRPENVLDMVPGEWVDRGGVYDQLLPKFDEEIVFRGRWPRNVWIGTTVENQRYLNVRMRHLARIPAPVRFLSMEPLLGPVDLTEWLDSIDWVIVGGETGPNARPMHPRWVRDLRDQCAARTTPCPNDTDGDGDCHVCARPGPFAPERGRHLDSISFFHKQWGDWTSTLTEADGWPDPGLWLADDGRTGTEDEAVADGGSWLGMHKLGKKRTGRELDGRTWDQVPTPRQAASV